MSQRVKEALERVQEVASRAFEYGAPALYEDDVDDLDHGLEELGDALREEGVIA